MDNKLKTKTRLAAIQLVSQQLINNQDIVLVNGGLQRRSFTYLNDGIDALKKMIDGDSKKLNGKIFNIGNPKGNLSIKDLAEKMITIYNELSDLPYKGQIIEKTRYYLLF